jgi:hypothetical protein
MGLMWAGFIGLVLSGGLAYLVRRRGDLLRLQSQVSHARAILQALLRQRRELAEVWTSLCQEHDVLPERMAELRRCLGGLARPPADAGEPLSIARLAEERRLGRLIRESYAEFLAALAEGGPSSDFFRQYFSSLVRLEREIADAGELHNDSVRVFNRALAGWDGWFFRRWEDFAPRAAVPSASDAVRSRLEASPPFRATGTASESTAVPPVPAARP